MATLPKCWKCAVCGKETSGRVPGFGTGKNRGDGSFFYPRRHKVNRIYCPGNIQEAIFINIQPKIMNAKEAREKVLNQRGYLATNQEIAARQAIEKAVGNNLFQTDISGQILPEVKEVLEKDGFAIIYKSCGPNEMCTLISWAE